MGIFFFFGVIRTVINPIARHLGMHRTLESSTHPELLYYEPGKSDASFCFALVYV